MKSLGRRLEAGDVAEAGGGLESGLVACGDVPGQDGRVACQPMPAAVGQWGRGLECGAIKPTAKLGKLWRNEPYQPSCRSPGPSAPSFLISKPIKPPRSFHASSSFSCSFLLPAHLPSRQFVMAPSAAATAGHTEGFKHLVDPNRKWYNNKRCVPTHRHYPAHCGSLLHLHRLITLHAWLVLL